MPYSSEVAVSGLLKTVYIRNPKLTIKAIELMQSPIFLMFIKDKTVANRSVFDFYFLNSFYY